jgi:hypothetical protein
MFEKKKEVSIDKTGIRLICKYQGHGFYKGVISWNGTQISYAFLKEDEIGDYRAKYDALFSFDDAEAAMELFSLDEGVF